MGRSSSFIFSFPTLCDYMRRKLLTTGSRIERKNMRHTPLNLTNGRAPVTRRVVKQSTIGARKLAGDSWRYGSWACTQDNLRSPRFSICSLTTVFVDTRLWKTKHSRKSFQNFRQSYVLSTCRIEIHQSQPLV